MKKLRKFLQKYINFSFLEWGLNLQPHDYQSSVFPWDHRAKLKNLAENVSFINDICKKSLLANKMYNLQTHFGFTNLWSEVLSFSYMSSQKVKKGTRTPCITFCLLDNTVYVIIIHKKFREITWKQTLRDLSPNLDTNLCCERPYT